MATRAIAALIPNGTRLPASEPSQFVTTNMVSDRAPEVVTKYVERTVQPDVTTVYASDRTSASKEPTVESLLTRPTQTTTRNTRAPSSDAVQTIRASFAASPSRAPSSDAVLTTRASVVASPSRAGGSATPDPSSVVTKTPLQELLKTEDAKVLPVLTEDQLPLTTDAPTIGFDYKTAGLIALAAVVAIGGLTMWSSSSRGKTQAIASNKKRRFHKRSNTSIARLKKETVALGPKMSRLSERRLMELAQYGRGSPEGRATMIELEMRSSLAQTR